MSFEIMKGFLSGFTTKGTGTSPETLPPDAKGDVDLGEKLDEKGNTKKGKRGSVGGGTEMNDNLTDIAAAAEQDIESGYVSTIQEGKSKGKGFDMFNDMVSKGVLVEDLEIKSTDIAGSLSEINESVKRNFDIDEKGMGSYIPRTLGQGVRAIKNVGQAANEAIKRNPKKTALAAGYGGMMAGGIGENQLRERFPEAYKKKED